MPGVLFPYQEFLTVTVSRFQAPTFAPSFPPIDDLAATLRRIDWPAVADRLLSAAMFVTAVLHALAVRIRPHLASMLRALADRLAPVVEPVPSAPALSSLTVAELRKLAREAGHPRSFYFQARKAALIAALS